MPTAVWRLAWQGDATAVLYGLAPGDGPTKFFIIRHDAKASTREGVFDHLPDGTWKLSEGDDLEPAPVSVRPPRRSRPSRRSRTEDNMPAWSSPRPTRATRQRSTRIKTS